MMIRRVLLSIIYCISVAIISLKAQDISNYSLEQVESFELRNDNWFYKTLIANESFIIQFPRDFRPYNFYLKASVAPLIIYNNPNAKFNKIDFFLEENGSLIKDPSHLLIAISDLSQMEVDYVWENFEDSIRGVDVSGVLVQSFKDDKPFPSGLAVKSYYLSFEDIYYWRIDLLGMDDEKVERLSASFLKNFVELNK